VAIDLAGQATKFVTEKMEQAGAWVTEHYDKLSMAGHLLLDGLGMVPGFGAIADGLNAVWYLAEGNYTDAAMSAFAAIPGIGDAAAAAKLGKRASGLGKTFKAFDKAGDALSGVKSAASAIGKTVKTSGPAKQMMAAADTARAFVDKVPDGLKQVVARYGNEIEAGAEFSVGTVMELNAAYAQYGDDLTSEQIQQIVLGNALSTTVGYGIGKGINKAADRWLQSGGVDVPNGRTNGVDVDTPSTRSNGTKTVDTTPRTDLTTRPRSGSDAETISPTRTRAEAETSTHPTADGPSTSVDSSSARPKTQTPNVEPNPDVSLSRRDRALLNESSPKRGDQLSRQELDAERTVASRAERKQINEGDYVEQIDLLNDHEWKKKKDGTWCRHSDDPVCGLEGPDGDKVPEDELKNSMYQDADGGRRPPRDSPSNDSVNTNSNNALLSDSQTTQTATRRGDSSADQTPNTETNASTNERVNQNDSASKSDENPIRVVRQDNNFHSNVTEKNKLKSRLNESGDFVPANPNGSASPLEHVYGSQPAKDDSPYTSFMTDDGTIAKTYGSQEVELDLNRLKNDINSGNLEDVKILTPTEISGMIKEEINSISPINLDEPLSNGPGGIDQYISTLGLSKGKSNKLSRRLLAYFNTTRDGEYLSRGVIPQVYLNGPYPVK